MAKTTGVEIDGNHVRVAQLNGSGVRYEEFSGASTVEAVDQWVKKLGKPGGDTIVCWSGRAIMRPTDIPESAPSALRAVINDTATRVLSTTTDMVVSGVISGEPVAGTQKAMIAAVDVANLAPVYERLGEGVRLMPSDFALTQDGTYLGVRASCVTLALVEKGYLLGARVLKIEGIDELSVVTRGLGGDRRAIQDKVDDYCDRVVGLTREALLQWSRDQRMASSSNVMFIHGMGSDVPGLRERLAAETGKQVVQPPVPGVNLTELAGSEHRAAQALFAATSGAGALPAVMLLNPATEAAKIQKAEQNKKRLTLLVLGGVAAALLVFIALPVLAAKARLVQAHRAHTSAVKKFEAVKAFDRLGFQVNTAEREVEEIVDSEPTWSRVIDFVFSNVPPGSSFTSVAFTPSGRTIKLSIALTTRGAAFEQPESYLQNLTRNLGVPDVFPRGLTRDDTGTITADFDIILPDDQRFFDSSPVQFPPPPAPGSPTTTVAR